MSDPSPEDSGRALRSFAQDLLSSPNREELLHELVHWVTELVDDTGAGLTLVDEARALELVAATDDAVRRVELAQQAEGEGPCLDAYARGAPVAVPDVSATDRWPRYAETAVAEGLWAVASVPMGVGAQCIGVLDVYARTPREFTDAELDTIDVLATVATAYVTTVGDLQRARRLATDLQRALDRRIPIEQAKGLVAGTYGLSVGEAFERLRARARREQRSVHDLATQLLAEGLPARWPSG